MDDNFKGYLSIALNILQALGIVVGAVWAYYRFRKEKPTHPRIEFDVDATFMPPQQGQYMATFAIRANNKGTVEHRFTEIRIRILGLKQEDALKTSEERAKRVDFPERIVPTVNILPEEFKYFFVRPGINQSFNYFTAISDSIRFIVVRLSFKYEKSEELHTTERVFEVKAKN